MPLSSVHFDLIRYANCWEDAEVLVRALQPLRGARVLSIASGGDNSFALLTAEPAIVVATDVSAVQLYVTELKAAAIRRMSREAYLAFAGFRPSARRWATFCALAPALSRDAATSFRANRPLVEGGLVHAGKFERYARFFARYVVPLVHSRRQVARLLEPKSASEQVEFYTTQWDTRRWRTLFRIFFGRTVLGRFGRDPEFLAQVQSPVADTLYERTRAALLDPACTTNYMIRYFFTGQFDSDHAANLPLYVRPGAYERVQANLDRLQLVHGLAEEAAQRHGPFDAFNLSNIFEYLDVPTVRRVGAALLANARPHARLAYWNLLAPRALAELLPDQLQAETPWQNHLRQTDRGFFYGALHIDRFEPAVDSFTEKSASTAAHNRSTN